MLLTISIPDLNCLIPVAIKMAAMTPPSTIAAIRPLGEYPSRVKILLDGVDHLQIGDRITVPIEEGNLTSNTLSETIQCRGPLATRSGIP
jgi:hypothetical protein